MLSGKDSLLKTGEERRKSGINKIPTKIRTRHLLDPKL